MTDDKSIVSFNLNELEVIANNAGDITLTPTAELYLLKWFEFEERFETIKEKIKDRLKAEMEKNNCICIDSEDVRIMRRFFGDKYLITDPNSAVDMGFASLETKVKVDSAEVDRYVKNIGDLPDGIVLKERTMSVVISPKKKKEEK